MIPLQILVSGRFKVESTHPETGVTTLLQDWAKNTVLTSGMYEMSQSDGWMLACQVGIDETNDPDPSFTSMPGWVAGTTNNLGSTTGAQSSATYYGWRRTTFRFPIGSVSENTNINRVGVGWGTVSGDNLTTLAKTVDIGGTPTAITWKADEYLDITYEFQYHVPTSDVTGTVVVDGVTYDYVVRAMAATSGSAWAIHIGNKIEAFSPYVDDWLAYDGDIGATVEDSPSGLVASSDNINSYTIAPLNVKYVDVGMNVGPGTDDVDGWSLTTGKLLRSLRIKTTAGWYQVQFDDQTGGAGAPYNGDGIPKTDQFTIASLFRLSWDEAP